MDSEKVALDGPITVRTASGYALDTKDATVDLQARTMASDGGVSGTTPQGTFRADSMSANLENRTVSLDGNRSEEHTSELQSLMRISYAVFCLKKKKENNK